MRRAEEAGTRSEAEPHLEHGRQASRAINAFRENHGQAQLEFERLGTVSGQLEIQVRFSAPVEPNG